MTRSINYMRLITSLGMIVFVGAIVVGGTGAFFNDTETSTGNVFTAGALDLKVDSVGHYNGLVCFDDLWHPESVVEWNEETESLQLVDQADVPQAIADYQAANPAANPTAGDDCASTWELTDLGPTYQFFTFDDLKPGDEGENTLSLHVFNNDAYACAVIDNMRDNDLGLTEPEEEDGDTTNGVGAGELAEELRFFAWSDDGDNLWEDGEPMLFSNEEGPASDVLDGVVYPLFTPQTQAILAEETSYVGLYWCYGDLTVDEGTNTLTCDGGPVTNLSQTDQLTADISFYVEQARNNEDFSCDALVPSSDDTVPTLEEITPAVGAVELADDETFVLMVDAEDLGDNLFELEVDHNIPALPEFTVYANEANPYGDAEAEAEFAAAGATVMYDAATEKWTIDFGEAATDVILLAGGITFFLEITDDAGNQFGDMFNVTPENTFVYSPVELEPLP